MTYGILNKFKAIKKSGEDDEHILPAYVPADTDTSSIAPAQMSLHNIVDMFVQESGISRSLEM